MKLNVLLVNDNAKQADSIGNSPKPASYIVSSNPKTTDNSFKEVETNGPDAIIICLKSHDKNSLLQINAMNESIQTAIGMFADISGETDTIEKVGKASIHAYSPDELETDYIQSIVETAII